MTTPPASGAPPSPPRGGWGLLLGLAALVPFAPALQAGWVNFDDPPNFLTNEAYRGFTADSVTWWLTTNHMGHYTPLVWLTAAVDYALWGLDPAGWHATNLLLHALSVAAVAALTWVTLDRVGRAGVPLGGRAVRLSAVAAAALLWGTHPLRVESVVWITERRDVLATPLFVAAAAAWIRRGPAGPAPSPQGLGAVVGLAALSCLAKAWAITLPAALLTIEAAFAWTEAPRGDRLRRLGVRGVESLPLWALSALFAWAAAGAQGASGTLKSGAQFTLLERLHVVGIGLLHYPLRTVWPADLSPLVPLSARADWPPLLVGLALLGGLAALVGLTRRTPWPLAAGVAYAAILSPASGIAQSGPQLVADRYAHLSTLPAFVLLAGVLAWVAATQPASVRRGVGAVVLAAGLASASATWQQSRIWTSSLTLWTAATQAQPDARDAWFNLGVALQDAGQAAQAPAAFARALAVGPATPRLHYAYGVALAQQGDYAAAIDALVAVPAEDPGWGRASRLDAARCAELLGEPHRAASLRAEAELAAPAPTGGRVRP